MEAVRWAHLVSALLWPASAVIGLWWTRSMVRPRYRRWMFAVGAVAILIGGENLLQAFAPHHPNTVAHLVANVLLAATGAMALFLVLAHGRGVATEEQVLRALSGGRLGAGDRRPHDSAPLTPRETEVVTCLCRGLGTDEIARRLGISRHTATTHIRNILRKLGVGSRTDAVVWAVERGVMDGRRHHRWPPNRAASAAIR